MIKSKLHNPVIAQNSHIENAVVQKVSNTTESAFSNLGAATPVVPETGRIWFNTDRGQYSFANIGTGGDGENYIDEFLSRTDLRSQEILSAVDFQNTLKVNATDASTIFTVNSNTKNVNIDGGSLNIELVGNLVSEVGGTSSITVTGSASESFSASLTTNVAGNVTENFSNSQQVNITNDLGFKVGGNIRITDGSDNLKLVANNSSNVLNINYATTNFNGQSETHTLSDKFVVNNGTSDKFILDNTNNKASIVYGTTEVTSANVNVNVTSKLTITDGTNNKIVANHSTNALVINYAETTINGNSTFDGNVLITGDLTIGGQTTKVDVASENLRIADNVIILNSNLDNTVDPRLASAIVDGTDVDYNAGVAVNRGSQGNIDLIKWVESTDTSSADTLQQAVAMTSIFNYEAATPAYELSQIINAYTLARQTTGKSGTSWVGYDGHAGTNYTAAISGGATSTEALDYSFKVDADTLDDVLDSIVQEIDDIKFSLQNTTRVGETPSAGTEFTITHNLGTVFVNVATQRLETDGKWYFDIMPVQVVDANTVKIAASESTKIRYMISAVEGFDVNQATELVII